ncbi:hypothetical protein FOZ61_007767 [Perkinsus olseni]|uniref:Uncharacterized protein n=1 Tax=Perkinsus olseni TaxID=32597 RepID=A0A7J6L7H8_PEROL|nr:hypothetical protein FOZ61_007767 [Perkinsus olseni]
MQSTCPEVADFSKISHYPEGANKEFQDKDKDQLLDFFLPKFEVERPLAHHLDGLFEVFGLTPEAVTVEVGPGTGLLTRQFSRRPGKKVYATELSNGFIQHLQADPRINKNKVEIIGCTEEDLCLPAETDASVDLAVLCDVYHHLTYPKKIIQQLRKALKDFWRDPNKSTREDKTWVIEHLRADKDVFVEEIRSEGFHVVAEPEIEGLIENYVVIFKKAGVSHFIEGANKDFQDKDKDELIDFFTPLFEVERPLAHHLDGLFEILGLTPEAVTVEVGPGTGLLTREFSRRPGKKVYAPELSDGFIQHLKTDPRIDNNKVEIIGCTEEDLCLPAESDGSVDLAVLCDVYHHLTYPKTIIQQLRKALKSENIHVTVYEFCKEIRAVGFDVVAEPEIEDLTEKYVVIFNKSSDEFF